MGRWKGWMEIVGGGGEGWEGARTGHVQALQGRVSAGLRCLVDPNRGSISKARSGRRLSAADGWQEGAALR